MARAADPIFELGFRLMGKRWQERVWRHVLSALAAYIGVQANAETDVMVKSECLDPRVQWSEAKNLWQNAMIRTSLYWCAAPARWLFHR
jgi:hypothetical protein